MTNQKLTIFFKLNLITKTLFSTKMVYQRIEIEKKIFLAHNLQYCKYPNNEKLTSNLKSIKMIMLFLHKKKKKKNKE